MSVWPEVTSCSHKAKKNAKVDGQEQTVCHACTKPLISGANPLHFDFTELVQLY